MFAAVVWHFWIAVVLLVPLMLIVIIGAVIGYLAKAQSPKYERIKE